MSTCLWSRWKWWGKEITSPFPALLWKVKVREKNPDSKKKLFVLHGILTLTKLKCFMSYIHDKVALLTRRHSEHETRNIMHRFVLEIYKTLIQRWIFDDSDETDWQKIVPETFTETQNELEL